MLTSDTATVPLGTFDGHELRGFVQRRMLEVNIAHTRLTLARFTPVAVDVTAPPSNGPLRSVGYAQIPRHRAPQLRAAVIAAALVLASRVLMRLVRRAR